MEMMNWKKLAVMAGLSFAAMFGLMYMMVDRWDNVIPNLNQLYMALTMTAAMVLIEVAVMSSMYDARTKMITAVVGVVGLAVFFMFTRYQTAVGDTQFLKSMIPHHASALLMCNEAEINDPDIKSLCDDILASQQEQIDWMKAKLNSPL